MDDQGGYYNLRTAALDPKLNGASLFAYAAKNGLIDRGASVGSTGTQAQEYSAELLAFFKAQLAR
jgi:hypothetical protein